jgi:drug/metabolite transporter (DMT)-like permease
MSLTEICPKSDMAKAGGNALNWTIFLSLSFIWGSSFILMKEGMNKLSPYQVAALRMLSGGVVLLPVAFTHFRKIPFQKLGLVFLSGILGSFIPAFLFCIAETKIDSSLASFLNALTPLFTAMIAIGFFKSRIARGKIIGICVGFAGMLILFLSGKKINSEYLSYSSFVVIAVISYALNINLVGNYLKDTTSTHLAAVAFVFLIPPSLTILFLTGYFDLPLSDKEFLYSTVSSVVLGVMGTAIGSIMFYILLKRAGAVFSSMVTYGIPFIALFWGLLAGEHITFWQIAGLAIILAGVYVANKTSQVKPAAKLQTD